MSYIIPQLGTWKLHLHPNPVTDSPVTLTSENSYFGILEPHIPQLRSGLPQRTFIVSNIIIYVHVLIEKSHEMSQKMTYGIMRADGLYVTFSQDFEGRLSDDLGRCVIST